MRVKTEQSIAVHVVAAFVVIIASLFAFVLSQFVYAAGETLSSPSDKTIYEGQHITIGDLQVNGSGNDQLTMILNASNGSLQFGNSEGLTFDGPDFGSTVQFGGKRSDINAALSTLRYSADNPGEHTIEATLGDGNYWAENGHVYMVVADPGTSWHDAKAAAEATTYGGVNGYLADLLHHHQIRQRSIRSLRFRSSGHSIGLRCHRRTKSGRSLHCRRRY